MAETEDAPQIKMAVMNNDIKHITESLARIEGKFDAAIQNFVTTAQLNDAVRLGELKHDAHEKAIEDLQQTVEALKKRDNEQQGAIEANQKSFNRTLAIIGVITGMAGMLWWLPSLISALTHK